MRKGMKIGLAGSLAAAVMGFAAYRIAWESAQKDIHLDDVTITSMELGSWSKEGMRFYQTFLNVDEDSRTMVGGGRIYDNFKVGDRVNVTASRIFPLVFSDAKLYVRNIRLAETIRPSSSDISGNLRDDYIGSDGNDGRDTPHLPRSFIDLLNQSMPTDRPTSQPAYDGTNID